MSEQEDKISRDVVFDDLMHGFAEARRSLRGEQAMRVTVLEAPDTTSEELTEQTVREYAVLYFCGEDGWEATVPDLPGCEAVGDSLEEAQNLIRYFIKKRLQELRSQGKPIPEVKTQAGSVTVAT